MTDSEADILRAETLAYMNGNGTESATTQTPAQAREDDARALYAMRPDPEGKGIDAETRAAFVRQIQAALKTV
jgi:hypothetical protein